MANITVPGVFATVTLQGKAKRASATLTIQSPGSGVLDFTIDESLDGGTVWDTIIYSRYEGAVVGAADPFGQVQGTNRLYTMGATLRNNTPSVQVRCNVREVSGGTWVVVPTVTS